MIFPKPNSPQSGVTPVDVEAQICDWCLKQKAITVLTYTDSVRELTQRTCAECEQTLPLNGFTKV